ncbi:hypothetical protein GMA19_00954 [Paenibacillus polymyxa E681]|uniref:hypothetical protein n=1 Tax=Paenibacillus polymyxa TaxID=1406 RepID=UPI0001E317F5|nr:hypothetical protein [Paenibacillus polymyxa]ADM68798.1 hypothetical protein PPE_00949 [Paenibacillus polymyxa E681]QNV55802.1 hypothetical protein GE561_00955 [Paenibacillus polymyxa E681]QNV60638.1 hypothetical protein GMA19_00954 [Paenibacillus polymyxa E681]
MTSKMWGATIAVVSYLIAFLLSFWLPLFVCLAIPILGLGGYSAIMAIRHPRPNLTGSVIPVLQEQVAETQQYEKEAAVRPESMTGQVRQPDQVSSEFAQVMEYLEVLEDMVISEGQKDALDNEIVEKALALFARLQRVIPLLHELNNSEVNHTVRRLILKDLNGLINPFLRLSGDAKRTNRRTLLNGLRDVDSKISVIVSTVEHKDLLELQSKAELIHQRYSSSEL